MEKALAGEDGVIGETVPHANDVVILLHPTDTQTQGERSVHGIS